MEDVEPTEYPAEVLAEDDEAAGADDVLVLLTCCPTTETATFDEFEHLSLARVVALLLKVISAHCSNSQFPRAKYNLEAKTYIVQRAPGLTQGHDLNTAICTIRGANSGGKSQVWQAKCTVARFVQWLLGERDVEDWVVRSKTEVDEDVGPWMVEVKAEGTAGHGPDCSIGLCGLIYIRTCTSQLGLIVNYVGNGMLTRVYVLRCSCCERVAPPFGILDTEMSIGK